MKKEKSLLNYYKNELGYEDRPDFIKKYEQTPSLLRLKKVGYFCGMDYASRDIYDFSEYISRYDHSITTALQTWNLTKNRIATLAALFHDISTPCFSHVIDYMNKDYSNQESTEEYTEAILKNDEFLIENLKQDFINIDDIIDFKKYSIVDNERPKICADRIDGVVLTAIGWTKNISLEEIKKIVCSERIFINEDKENEIGFESKDVAKRITDINKSINKSCHSSEDNYMMELLAEITKRSISRGIIKYSDLYKLNEEQLFNILNDTVYFDIRNALNLFKTIKMDSIPTTNIDNLKKRNINPLVKGRRLKK